MRIKDYLNQVCEEIKYQPVKNGISEELESHIQELKEEYLKCGMSEKDAEEKAITQMGNAREIGKKLNKIHKPKLDWKLLCLIIILIGYGIILVTLKQSATEYNIIAKTIVYMIVGFVVGIITYFFDYKKIQKLSNAIYIIATIIMVIPLLMGGVKFNGVTYYSFLGYSFMPCILTIPLYIISFVGFINEEKKEKIINISFLNKEFKINTKSIKTVLSSLLSIILVLLVPSVANAVILSLIYLTLATIKILQNKENKTQHLILLYAPIILLGIIIVLFNASRSSYLFDRFVVSYKPETDPQGRGYIGMVQKEVMQNAQMFGSADTEFFNNYYLILNNESNLTFIYVVGKVGIVFSIILVLTILLASIRIILNSKNIKDQYGKSLMIGLGVLFILQSVISVLTNLNLFIQMDVNMPFVSYGGAFFIANILSMGIILSIYRRKDIDEYSMIKAN